MAWPTGYQPFGPNRAPLLVGLSSSNGATPIPVAVNPATGAVLTSGGGGGGGGLVQIQDSAGNNLNSTSGALDVFISGGSSSGVQYAELATTTPATGTLALGRYQTSLPTLTNGQMNEPMLDTSSRLLVNVATGTITANAGTNLNTSALALESGGNLATIVSDLTNASQKSQLVDASGNVVSSVVPGTANSSGNAVLTGATSNMVSFTTTTVQAVASTDVGNYRWVSVQINTQGGSSAITFQGSNDNTNWMSVPLSSTSQLAAQSMVISTSAAAAIYAGPLQTRYFRLNVTGIVSGTTAGVIQFSSLPNVIGATQGVTQVGITTPTSLNAAATGTITTSSSSIMSTAANGYGGFASVSIHGPTYAGVSFGITVSDDSATTFYPTSVYDVSAQQWLAPSATISPGTNASRVYLVPLLLSGVQIKVLASAYSSGTANIRIGTTAAPAINPSYMSQIMDSAGNNRGVNVTAGNALQVDASATTQPVSQATASSLNATVVGTGTFVTQSTLAAETTKVIGVVRNADGSGNLLTSTAGSLNVVQQAATGTLSNVASSATSVVILASNSSRKAATVYNDSTQILYLKFGTTASTTSFTAPLAAATYYEVPGGYTGEIDGIWASSNGFARVTEIT